jgi:hypothetical protein
MAKGAREVQFSLMTILLDLADYDGNRVAVLEAIKRSRKPGPDVMAELVALAGADDPNVATGATWLLRAYVEDGTPLESDLVSSLAPDVGRNRRPVGPPPHLSDGAQSLSARPRCQKLRSLPPSMRW